MTVSVDSLTQLIDAQTTNSRPLKKVHKESSVGSVSAAIHSSRPLPRADEDGNGEQDMNE